MGETRTRQTQHVGRVSKIEDGLRLLRKKGKTPAGSGSSRTNSRLQASGKLDEAGRTRSPKKRSTERRSPERRSSERRSSERVYKRPVESNWKGKYQKRYVVAAALVCLGILVFVLVASVLGPIAGEHQSPIDAGAAKPDTTLAEAGGLRISTPIHPADLTGLGYHPDGDSIIGMSPRGRNLSSNPISRLFTAGQNPADIRYYVMSPAGRPGPTTGALDVEAKAGAVVYAPVTGVITAIRPDPMLPEANVIEIKPAANPNLRVYVSLVRKIDSGIGVYSSVTAGETALGSVTDSAKVLHPQLSSYTGSPGNHVTVSVLSTN